MSSTQPEQQPRRYWLVPIVCLFLIVLGLFAWPIWDWFDLTPTVFQLFHGGGRVLAILAGLVLLGWFFLVQPVPRWLLQTVAVLLALTVLFFAVTIDGYEVTGDLSVIPHFRWQGWPEHALQQHLDQLDATGLPEIDATIDEESDFPCYRGLHRDGAAPRVVVYELDWDKSPPKLLWRQPCGGGFSGLAVAGNIAVTIETRDNKEVAICYDRTTGKQRWATPFADLFTDPTGSGPRSTPTIHEGSVYVLGAKDGTLARLDAKTGEQLWSVDTLKDCRAQRVTWGMTSSPLILGEVVVINAGIDKDDNAARALAAYRIKDGSRAWAVGKHAAGYSSPMLATLAGQKQILLFDAGGLAGFHPDTQEELWRYPWTTFMDMNIIQPLVIDNDKVLISSEPGNGAALLRVVRLDDGSYSATDLWQNHSLVAKYANPVLVGSSVFGLSNGTMVCLDPSTGRRLWRGRHYGHGQLLALNGSVLVLSERGEVALVSADARQFRELHRFQAIEGRTWNTHTLAGRHLFVRNDKEIACYELPVLSE